MQRLQIFISLQNAVFVCCAFLLQFKKLCDIKTLLSTILIKILLQFAVLFLLLILFALFPYLIQCNNAPMN